jgi:hypothetical protein
MAALLATHYVVRVEVAVMEATLLPPAAIVIVWLFTLRFRQ